MKAWKVSITALLLSAAFVSTALAHSHPGNPNLHPSSVSPWAQTELKRAQDLGLTPKGIYFGEDYRVPITRGQFTTLVLAWLSVQQHCDLPNLRGMVSLHMAEKTETGDLKRVFSDINNQASDDTSKLAAYYLGIVKGREDGRFDADGQITRQEAATMLTRAYTLCGGTLPEKTSSSNFIDERSIADWAKESCSALASWKVMNGLSDGSFAPENPYSIEQCLLTLLRLYENTPVSRKNGNIKPLFTYEQALTYIDYLLNYPYGEGVGETEKIRLAGPNATFIRMDWGGTMHAWASLYFVHRDGAITPIDLGICDSTNGFPVAWQLENPHFLEGGKTFFCSVRLPENIREGGKLLHSKGLYHIRVDVETGQYQHQMEALPK